MLKIYLVCLSYLLIGTDVVRCKPDYLFKKEVNGWLKLHNIPATWEQAFLRCHYEGAVLASPLNKELVSALLSVLEKFEEKRGILLGTRDLFSTGDFNSVEGVPLSELEIKWGYNEPDTGDCLYLLSFGSGAYSVHANACKERRPYICYKKFDYELFNECGTLDNEYIRNRQTGSCYKVHNKRQTWTSAYRICASEGGHLVILNDEKEARVITDMFSINFKNNIQGDEIYVGVQAWGDDRAWTTIHGDRLKDVYHDWYPGLSENYNGDERYMTLLHGGTLGVSGAGTKAAFVCERSPDSKKFEASPLDIEHAGGIGKNIPSY